MAEFDFTMEPVDDRDLAEREERCQKAMKVVAKAIFMRLFICGLLIWIVLRTGLEIWAVGLMILVMLINFTGVLPLVAELKKRRTEWKQLLSEEEN